MILYLHFEEWNHQSTLDSEYLEYSSTLIKGLYTGKIGKFGVYLQSEILTLVPIYFG
jgi:hypothetical protein